MTSDPVEESQVKKPLPVQRFENIITDIKRILGRDNPLNPEFYGGPGGSAKWTTQIDSELDEPENDYDPYRAKIIVSTKATYTVINLPKDEPVEDSKNKNSAEAMDPDDPEADPLNLEAGVEEGALRPGREDFLDSPIKSFDTDEVAVFELEYQEHRWRLLNQPDADTQSALAKAFEFALKRQ